MKTLCRAALLLCACWLPLASATPLEITSHDNIVYLADSSSNSVARYSLASQSFLAPISLSQNPLAIHADASGIYASYGTRIVKLALDGTGEADFRTISENIHDIEATDTYLVLGGYSYLQVVNKATGTLVDSRSLWYTSPYISLAPDGSEIFTTSSGISPADIYRIPLAVNGALGNTSESPYHGTYDVGQQVQTFANQNRIIDSSGNLYNLLDFSYAGNLGGAYTALAFWRNQPLVLRDNQLVSYNLWLQQTNSRALNLAAASDLQVYEDYVMLFDRTQAASPEVEVIAVSELNLADPDQPLSPATLAYKPDDWALDADQDTLYLFSKTHLSIFRWSISQQQYLATIPLQNSPQQFHYSPQHQRIYLAYKSGDINYINLADDTEHDFAQTESTYEIPEMLSAGSLLIVSSWEGYTGYALNIYNQQAELLQRHIVSYGYSLAWDGAAQRLWSQPYLQWLQLNTAGEKTDQSSLYFINNDSWGNLFGVSETGRFIALSRGQVVDYAMQPQADVLTNNYFTDLVWLHGNLFGLQGVDNNTYTQVDRWNADFSRDQAFSQEYLGEPVGLVPVASLNKLLVIYRQNGKPVFALLDAQARDSDSDGVMDAEDLFPADATETIDFDRDGVGDTADTDDDNDGVIDTLDLFPFDKNEALDTDSDGTGNNADTDDDNDSVLDVSDAFPTDPAESSDIDSDGIGDNADTDRDGDGYANDVDQLPNDRYDWIDNDQDGIGDQYQDDDDDNDGVSDYQDAFPLNPLESGDIDYDGIGDNADTDRDGDGVANDADALPNNPYETVDSDADGTGNNSDYDDDNDGVEDYQDAFPLDPLKTADMDGDGLDDTSDPDIDGDGWLNEADAFPSNYYEHRDSDNDGIGNNSDYDDDNDGIPDYLDATPDPDDIDNDGISNSIDPDRDGDGAANENDLAPDNPNEWVDSDNDGTGNGADTDDDNDGVADSSDFYPLDASKSALNAADFLPMAKSNRWVFDHSLQAVTVGSDKKIGGQTIRPLHFPYGGKVYLKVLNNQVQFFGVYFPQVQTEYGDFSTDFLLDKGINLTASGNHTGKGDVVISPEYGKRSLSWTAQVQYLGGETVAVPAGQYAALHTRIYFTGKTTIEGVQMQISYQADYWFAEDVGLVKISESGYEMNLVSATASHDETANGGSGGGDGASGGDSGGGGGGGGGSLNLWLLALLGLGLFSRRRA